jgi:hypothetical protein
VGQCFNESSYDVPETLVCGFFITLLCFSSNVVMARESVIEADGKRIKNEGNQKGRQICEHQGYQLKASASRKFLVSQQLTVFCRRQTLKRETLRTETQEI